ncbi:MAG: endospore germination permease [Bacilli bacterium]|nr:endospore germination permease [Bacilli bacterium]MDD4808953.1 endospore germination permease [Bacilli bacterium]
MGKNNNIISPFQIGIMGFFLGNAFFVGMGNLNVIALVKQDAWISALMSIVICLIPLAIILYIINYQPDKNIIEKNKLIFGKWIGSIINIIMVLYIFIIFIILIWATTNFAIIIYLTDTPRPFIILLFLLVIIYTVIKGIETIARTNEILFFITITIIVIIIIGLYQYSDFYNVKPIMKDGIFPIIKGSLLYLAYSFPPLITLLMIPKKMVKNEKLFNKSLIGGFVFSIILIALVFYINVSIITANLFDLYRMPAYYVLKKINIADYIDNVENFLSLHWIIPLFVTMTMCLYCVSEYIKQTFKIKKEKYINLSIIVIALIAGIISNYLFKNGIASYVFMNNWFPYSISLIILIMLIITAITIYIKKKKANQEKNQDSDS